MPLLYKKAFERKEIPPGLKESDEVFLCELTEEIFTDYEEFCERIYLCNSLVWSCSITGRSNLTFEEALISEKNARKVLADFPLALRIPLLYLVTITERKSLSELIEDIFAFVRERFFVGEAVEVNFSNDSWCDCHVVQVTYPTKQVLEEYQRTANHPNNSPSSSKDYWPPASVYSYEVELVGKNGVTYFVRGDKVKRRKGLYTRDKNKLFLKQYVCQKDNIWKLKDAVSKKYSVNKVHFDDIFAGDAKKVMSKKKPTGKEQSHSKTSNEKGKSNAKKDKKQESIQKYLKQKSSSAGDNQQSVSSSKKTTPQKKASTSATPQKTLIQKLKNKYKSVQNGKKSKLVEKINKKGIELQEKKKNNKKKPSEPITRRLTKDELLQLALKYKDKNPIAVKVAGFNMKLNKENRTLLSALITELNRRREDLECEDLKDLPVPTAIQLRIPNECFGDFVMILEFFYSFGRVVKLKNYFPVGVTIDLVERALIETEVAGPLNDFVQLLLSAIFELQELNDETCESNGVLDSIKEVKSDLYDVVLLSHAAASYSQRYQGVPLNQLTLDCATLTEILRLHLLSSGLRRSLEEAVVDRHSFGIDDPGRALCITRPDLIKTLSEKSLFELPVVDKIQILICLINQVLSFASVRDVVDERGEKIKAGRIDLRNQQAAELKKQKEAITKAKEQKEKEKEKEVEGGAATSGPVTMTAVEIAAIKEGRMKKAAELARKARFLSESGMEFQVVPLGVDRAYRRFWLFSSLPGLFVEDNETDPGTCLPKGTPFAEDAEECLLHVRKLFEDGGPNNKENLVGVSIDHVTMTPPNSVGTNKKMLAEKNGAPMDASHQHTPPRIELVKVETPSRGHSATPLKNEVKNPCRPLTCWGDPCVCPVHNPRPATVWSFFKTEGEVDQLIESLNSRGYRESKLKKILLQEKQRIVDSLAKCPLSKLDPSESNAEQHEVRKSSRYGPKYDNPNLDLPSGTPINEVLSYNLKEIILENEDKIYGGLLGSLKVNDRDEWRRRLKDDDYDKQCDLLQWGNGYSDPPDTINSTGKGSNQDAFSLADKIKMEVADSDECGRRSRSQTPVLGLERLTNLDGTQVQQRHVYNFACAILQLEQSVESRYLKKPLAVDDDEVNGGGAGGVNQDSPKEQKKNKSINTRLQWEESLMACRSLSQLFIHLYTLENSIEWSKSALKTYSCQSCRQRDPEKMLLCDSCNKGYHMYCLKPKLVKVPVGDWFCPKCQQKIEKENEKKGKRAKEEEEDERREAEGVIAKCKVCRSRGETAQCDDCGNCFHLECINPPLRKFPRFTWTCPDCRHQSNNTTAVAASNNRKLGSTRDRHRYEANDDSDSDNDNDDNLDVDVERCPSRRRCAKTATAKISQFAKQLRTNSLDGDDDDEVNRESEDNAVSHASRRRSRRSMELGGSDVTLTSSRDLPLDNAALQEILDVVIHHKDAWPFIRPVTKSEVPDYHKIIKCPMDFGTIKHKLNMLEYSMNGQVIADAMLVFNNCYTYNQADTEVFKAGERLEKVFVKLCTERKMKVESKCNASVNGDATAEDHEEQDEDIRPPVSKKSRTVF